jgi:hypothetical protein
MSKAYLFAIFLLAASFTGCIGGEDLEEITTEEETLDPIGEDNMTSLRKEIDDLKATIKSYEKPKVYFMMDDDNDPLFCDEDYGYSCNLIAKPYDVNGVIESYKWESSESNFEDQDSHLSGECYWTMSDNGECLSLYNFIYLDVCDIYGGSQTLTLTVFDNDGNSASASYDYVESEDLCGPPEPMITFFVQESSSGAYHIEVIKVTEQLDLAGFTFFLKDETGSTYVGGNGFGEVALQMIDGNEHGIENAYDGEDEVLERRANNISADDGSEFPVHFSDNDRDGKLSAGDLFMVYGTGNSASGPAAVNWRLDIQLDADGTIVGSAKLL